MTNWNRYISTTTTPIATKLGRVVTYVKGILPKKSHCSWVTYFCEITWQFKTYLHYHNAYSHQTWQGGSQLGGTPTHNVTWFFNYVAFWDHLPNSICNISTCTRALDSKYGKIGTYCKGLPPIKLHDPFTRVHVKSREKWKLLNLLPKGKKRLRKKRMRKKKMRN